MKKKSNHTIKSKKIIPSSSSISESSRILKIHVTDLVKQYIDLPLLPTNKEINIDKIGVYNWDTCKRKPKDLIMYSIFTDNNPDEFPLGTNPSLDYMPNDYVSPVIIVDTNGNKYRTKDLYWFPLIDVSDGIILKQSITGKKIFPQKVFIDEDVIKNGNPSNKWIPTLLNLVGYDTLKNMRQQM